MVHDVHIEYCHIYTDEMLTDDHMNSIHAFKHIKAVQEKEGKSYVASVLIDDYNAEERLWELSELTTKLSETNALPDIVAYESSCVHGAEQIIRGLPSSVLKTEHFRREKKDVLFLLHEGKRIALKSRQGDEEKYTCSILGAAWHGSKLGLVNNKYVNTPAEEIITILPRKYHKVEENMKTILGYLDSSVQTRIHNIYTA